MNYQFNYGMYFAICQSQGVKDIPLLWLGLILFVIVGAYLLGSINSAIIISKIFYGDDIRRHGSGNAGTTNMLRTYGGKAAVFTLVFDMLKTVIAIFIAGILFGFQYVGVMSVSRELYVSGLFAVLGHIFPVYYRGKGGKGVLCAATMALMLSPIVFGLLILLFVGIVWMTKYVSLGSVVGVGLYPVMLRAYMATIFPGAQMEGLISLSTVILGILIIWCHRANLKRIMNREENQISFKKKAKKPTEESQEQGK